MSKHVKDLITNDFKNRLEGVTDALLVNERALVTDLGGKYVLVVDENNVVDKRLVQLGQLVDEMRVVTEGLQPDERYIVKGIQRARPGFPVEPTVEPSMAEPAKPVEENVDENAVAESKE